MPLPTNPLIIWAKDDVNLPNTGKPNKAAPQQSLSRIGWDEGQEPSCEEFNYILNNLAQYIQYYKDESDATIANLNTKRIDTGTGLTGGGNLSADRTISLSSISSCISILTGSLNDGGTIPLPSGYSAGQCVWFVTPKYLANQGGGNITTISCSVDSSRVVNVKVEGAGGTNTANYVIIGVK